MPTTEQPKCIKPVRTPKLCNTFHMCWMKVRLSDEPGKPNIYTMQQWYCDRHLIFVSLQTWNRPNANPTVPEMKHIYNIFRNFWLIQKRCEYVHGFRKKLYHILWQNVHFMSSASLGILQSLNIINIIRRCYSYQLKALGLLYAFEKSADWAVLSSFCDDANLHISALSHMWDKQGIHLQILK